MKKGQKSKSRSKSKKEKKPVTEEEDSKEDLTSENNPQSPNLYSLLGVEKTATNAEIKKAYRRLVFMYHPDKNKTDPDAGAKFANISRAYKILSNPDNRKIYELLEIAAYAENYSSHPISLSIKEAWKKTGNKIDETRIGDVKEHAGRGVAAVIDGIEYSAGNRRLMDDLGLADALPEGEDAAGEAETIIYIASTGPAFLGYIALSDVIKTDSAEALRGLGELGVHDTVMLTGDLEAIAGRVAGDLGISKHYSELLPQDKVRIFEEIISASNGNVVFVGDGLNDAPTLARADVGIAMGGAGSQAAIEAADIVIMDDAPSKIPAIMRIARKTQHIAKQNVVFALAVKGVVLLLGAIGIANMWMAVFADVGVAVLCILNSMRMISMRGQK